MRVRPTMLVATASLLVACSSGSTPTAKSAATSTTANTNAAAITNVWKGSPVDPKKIPLGDGHKSTTAAAVGSVFNCGGGGGPGIGGANVDGPWIHGDTWDSTAKVAVQGSVTWPSASYTMSVSGGTRTIKTNDLPTHEKTGTFPIASGDPAHAYDQNPNRIAERATTLTLPASPSSAANPTCLGGGPIGMLTNGVFLFDALDGPGRDAAAHETQDLCDGHPAPGNQYHYHAIPSCLLTAATGSSTVVGWGYDGFPIVIERDAAGNLPTNADLDECHGRTSPILADGKTVTMYHYSATTEYPYSLGCFRGAPA